MSKPRKGGVAGKVDCASIRDLTLAIDVLRVRGHTRRAAAVKVAQLPQFKDLPP